MKHTSLKLAGLLGLAALPALADVKINENLSLSGYAVGAATTTDPDAGGSVDSIADSGISNLDSIKVALTGTYDAVSGKVSLFYVPGATSSSASAGILDAYASYSADGVTFTGGKFLSYLGYEAFDAVNMTQLTYATTIGAVPAYHTGVKFDYAGDGFGLGLAVVDSLFPDTGFYQGDGDFSDEVAYEAIATYTGIKGLTLFAGIGYDETDGTPGEDKVYDLWASYALSESVTVAAEYDIYEDVSKAWLALVQYKFCDKLSAIARVSSIDVDASGDCGTYLTVAPTYVFTENFSLRAEVSYADSPEAVVGTHPLSGKGYFYGAQAVFKF